MAGVDRLGNGGQGVVYKVADVKGVPSERDQVLALQQGLRGIQSEIHQMHPEIEKFTSLIAALRTIARPLSDDFAALKELHPFEDAVNGTTALARMKAELEVLSGISHPALLKMYDSNVEKGWFVMEYFQNGPMSKAPNRFRGSVMESLKALRPVVYAVGELHKRGIVHRDIKPEIVFVADDGRLVLGDCGLAIKLDNMERLTLSFENVGTRDYQPPWTYATRVQDVKPNFDVFSLGKLLWSMISGRPRFPLEDFDIEPNDLRKIFPDNPDVLFAHRIFSQCIVRREPQCTIPDASRLLEEVDEAIHALSAGGQVPSTTTKMRCRFCAIGYHGKISNFQATGSSTIGQNSHFYACDHCGHLETFIRLGNKTPAAWTES